MERRIVLAIAAIFCFGYTFHELWLVYDLACVWAMLHLLARPDPRARGLAKLMIAAIVACIVASALVHPTSPIWLLGIWDTLKHVFLWLYLFRSFYDRKREPSFLTSRELYSFLTIAFVANVVFAGYQVLAGVGVDDIAGFFGPGATHSFGYFMILYFLLSYLRGKSVVRLAAILVVCAAIAVVSDSMGFFILLPLWFFVSIVRRGSSRRNGVSIAAGVLAIAGMMYVLGRTQPEFVDSLVSRAVNVVQPETEVRTDKPINSRGTAIAYAAMVGGWVGDGPGTYSIIYGIDGPSAWLLDFVQITICEVSHLLCEWGVIGLVYVTCLFAVLIFALRIDAMKRTLLFAVFIATMMHGALLMDERIIFFEMLIVLAILSGDAGLLRADAPAPPHGGEDPRGREHERAENSHREDLATLRA